MKYLIKKKHLYLVIGKTKIVQNQEMTNKWKKTGDK